VTLTLSARKRISLSQRDSGIPSLMASTTNDIAGQPIAGYLGIVRGIVVRTPSIAQGVQGRIAEHIRR
jgi:hypothetical protein